MGKEKEAMAAPAKATGTTPADDATATETTSADDAGGAATTKSDDAKAAETKKSDDATVTEPSTSDDADATEETASKPDAEGDESTASPPEPDPETCTGVALCLSHFEESVIDGEWQDTKLRYYLEPAGVLQARLRCERCEPGQELGRGGLFMTRSAWLARTVYLSGAGNPEVYELSYPREYGYVKTLSHYQPATRKSAKYPWSKKY